VNGPAPGNVQADPTQRLRLLLNATIVSAGGRDWTGRDLVTAGALSGRWRSLETDLVLGLTGLERWTPAREEVKAALREFRYARRLISADEFSDWLRQRGLAQRELAEAIRRRLAREHDSETRAWDRLGQGQTALAALPAEAIYTGALLDCAQWLVDRVLCLDDGPAPEVEPAEQKVLLERERELMASEVIVEADTDRRARAGLMLAAGAAYDARVAEMCSARAISTVLRRHALDWLHFQLIGFTCATAGAAAEIAALLRAGTPPETITEVSGVPGEQMSLYVEDAPTAIQGWLGSALPGAVVGPLVEQQAHRTWLVQTRQSPDPGDPSVAGRARGRIVEEYMRRRRAGRVKWHERH
jgi:hypothetical protein